MVNHFSILLFCLGVSNCCIIGAQLAYHGCIAIEPTRNLNCLHGASVTRQVRKLRPRLRPRSLPSRRAQIFGSTTMHLSDRTPQFFKTYLPSACSDLALRRSLGNLLNELPIAQESLIDRLVAPLLVPQALSAFNKPSICSTGPDLPSSPIVP
jgi:hypothetical protein